MLEIMYQNSCTRSPKDAQSLQNEDEDKERNFILINSKKYPPPKTQKGIRKEKAKWEVLTKLKNESISIAVRTL